MQVHSNGCLPRTSARQTAKYRRVPPRVKTSLLRGVRITGFSLLVTVPGLLVLSGGNRATAQPATFALFPQHTALYSTPVQPLAQSRWTTTIDFGNSAACAHYGAPLITLSNTVIVPVKTTNGTQIAFQVKAFEGATGRLKYTLTTDYLLPTYNWIPAYQPVLASGPSS